MKTYEGHLITPQWITVIFDEGHPINIARDDARFDEVLHVIRSEQFGRLACLSDRSSHIREYTKGKFHVKDGVIIVDGDFLPEALSDKLLALIDTGEDTTPLERFWQNLKKNPSRDSRHDLFEFLRANKIPITPNGCFIAYKKVRKDYTDCHTGKISNKPGQIVKMPRHQVDADRNRTCSSGLHVAAFAYANNFSSGHLLEIEINPRDVVAVPPDYNQQKMRVCRYRVIRHATTEIEDLVYRQKPKTIIKNED